MGADSPTSFMYVCVERGLAGQTEQWAREAYPTAWHPSPSASPLHTHIHTHTGSLQEYLVPICTNDSLCLMHFMEDEVGYSFGRRERVGEVSGRSALPYRFPSTHFSWSIF